jgi:eukaryotic-like serine/threonine-protein kinase
MAMPTIQRQISASTRQDPQRELLQDRLGLYGRIGAAFCLVYLVLVNVFPAETKSWQDILFCIPNAITVGVAASFASTWLITRARILQSSSLRAVDLVSITLVGLLTAGYGWLTLREMSFSYNGVLAVTNALCFRAALIPSTARRTLYLGMAAVTPTVALALAHSLLPGISVQGDSMLGYVLAWCSVGVGISTVISSVIFGLQQRARRAERLGQYELLDRIGAGAMGEVFRARHAMLRRPTAIKLLKPHIAGRINIARFEREVQHTAALTHPNTIAIYDYGRTPDGLFYYAMEFLDGTDLQRLVDREGPQPVERVLHILRQICGSLTEAHEAGLVHRDIKAANVFLCHRGGVNDVVKVLDFGLVQHTDDAQEGKLAGTPTYLAPECILSPGTVTTLADIYAVGVLAYVLLTGRVPVGGSTVDEILANQVQVEPRPPSHHLASDLPPALEAVVMACLAKDPGDRPVSARKLDTLLESCDPGDGGAPTVRAPSTASAVPTDPLLSAETLMPDEV